MVAYKTLYSHLVYFGYTVSTKEEDYKKTNRIEFLCENKHINKFSGDALNNKRRALNKEGKSQKDLCLQCVKETELKKSFEQNKEDIKNLNGHILVSLDLDDRVVYICGICREENKCSLSNLFSNKGRCNNCNHEPSKNDVEEIKKELKEVYEVELLEYKNNKNIKECSYLVS